MRGSSERRDGHRVADTAADRNRRRRRELLGMGLGAMESLELTEKLVGFAILTTSSAFFSTLVIFVNVLKFFLAFLPTPIVSQLC